MQVKITTDGEKIIADIPYAGGRGPKLAKDIPGHKPWFQRANKPGEKDRFIAWVYPLTRDTCHVFRRKFGRDLLVSNLLAAWYTKEVEREGEIENYRSDPEFAKAYLYGQNRYLAHEEAWAAICNRSYQLTGTAWLVKSGGGLLGDQPGLGKTVQTIAALMAVKAMVTLVVCPRTATRTVWENEIHKWWPEAVVFVAQGNRGERTDVMRKFNEACYMPNGTFFRAPAVLVVNTEMVRAKKIEVCPDGNDQNLCEIIYSDGNHKHKSIPEYTWPFLFEQEWDAIVMDESHKILASTYNLQSKKITQGRRGAMYLRKCLKKDGGLPIALSGTPFRSKLVKAWGTLNWVRPDMFTSFWNFAQTHFDVNEGEYGGNEISAEPVDIDAFNAAMRPYYLARDKKTAAPDLPDINYINVIIPMEDKQAKAYSQIKKLAKVRLESGTLNAVGVLAELTRCRQFACAYGDVSIDEEQDTIQFRPELPSSKLDWVLEFLEEREGNAGKVVVASGFTSLLNMASKYVAAQGHANYLLTGKTTDKQRLDIVRKFQDDKDPVSVLFLNMYAGGEAITLDAADDMILLDLPWTSDQEEQLTSRLHRVSRIHNVTVYRLLSENTIDEWMQDLTEEQRRIMLSARPESASLAAGVLIPDWVQ